MLRFMLLAGVLILSLSGSETEKALTACEEHDFKKFRAPPIDTIMTRNPGEFDIEPSKAELRFYLEDWNDALKRAVNGVGTQLTFWEYSWSETQNYCFYHRASSRMGRRNIIYHPIERGAETIFESETTEIIKKDTFLINNKNYETLYLIYTLRNKKNYCTIFRASWEGEEQPISSGGVYGFLCTSKNRPMPPDALETMLTHITHLLGPSDPPLDIGTMPVPQ